MRFTILEEYLSVMQRPTKREGKEQEKQKEKETPPFDAYSSTNFSFLLGLNLTTFWGGMATSSPVFRFLPFLLLDS